MALFPANPQRIDPYKNFKFRVKWGNVYVAAVSKVSVFKRTTDVVAHRDGGDMSIQRKSPGRSNFDPISMDRGITMDMAFYNWAGLVWNYGAALGSEVSLANFRKDLYLEVYNEAGQLVIAYNIFRCWVSEYQALPDLDANANAIAIEHIKIEHEGWQRDLSVAQAAEPALSTVTV